VVICLEEDANDLHVVQLMPLPPHHHRIQNGLLFWCRLTQVVLEKRPLNGCSSGSSYSVIAEIAYCMELPPDVTVICISLVVFVNEETEANYLLAVVSSL